MLKKRQRNPYPFIPKHATRWRKVYDITAGAGIAPHSKYYAGKRKPYSIKRKIINHEEYKWNVPKPLKNYKSPFTPDVVADMLGLEDSEELYRWLELDFEQPGITEEEHYEQEQQGYIETEEQLLEEISFWQKFLQQFKKVLRKSKRLFKSNEEMRESARKAFKEEMERKDE